MRRIESLILTRWFWIKKIISSAVCWAYYFFEILRLSLIILANCTLV